MHIKIIIKTIQIIKQLDYCKMKSNRKKEKCRVDVKLERDPLGRSDKLFSNFIDKFTYKYINMFFYFGKIKARKRLSWKKR